MTELQDGDIVFQNATIFDGSGDRPRYVASVVVRDGVVHTITEPAKLSHAVDDAHGANVKTVDCHNGHWSLCPGFIDMHAHSDLSLLHTPDHLAKITQGGHCSPASSGTSDMC